MIKRAMPSVMCVFVLGSILVSAAAAHSKSEQRLSLQFSSEPTRYDPLFLEDGTALRLAANTIATLYEYDSEGNLKPALIAKHEISPDHKTYTFHFRNNLKWSDGKAFHAEQFILALQRLTREPVKAALSALFPPIDLEKTKALDSVTARVGLKDADAHFLLWLSLPPFAPIRSDIIDQYKKRELPIVPTLAAYQVVDYKRENHLSLEKNANFYDASQTHLKEIEIKIVRDEAPLMPLLKSGAVDILTRVPVLQVNQIEKFANIERVSVQAVTYLGLNTKRPPFSILANRQKLRNALYLKKFSLAKLLKTDELPALFFIPPSLAPLERKTGSLNLDEKQPIAFEGQSDIGSRNQTIMEWVQGEAKTGLNWNMKIDMMEWKAHYSRLKNDPAPLFRFGWQNPVNSAYVTYQVLQSNSINNFTGWKNKNYDRLVDVLRQTDDVKQKQKLIEKIEAILFEESPVIPVLHQVLTFACSKRVVGFRANPFGVVLFRELRLASQQND